MMLRCLFAFIAATLFAETPPAVTAARAFRERNEAAIVREFVELLSIPNIARDKENIRRNAELIRAMLEKRGIAAKLLEAGGANPAVYGEIPRPGAQRTILFYAHYDGQPLDPKEWASPPFTPTLRDAALENGGRVIPFPVSGRFDPEWRLYARSAGDDKAPVVALLAAYDALREARLPLQSNIKFFFEGEEEAGSPNLARILEAHKPILGADVWLICDGPVHQSRKQQIVFGARGNATVNITVYGPRRELHSGHYGNWAPNPAMMLSRLLASMKDDDGRVLIEEFYKGIEPLSETEKRALAEAPNYDEEIRRELWLGRSEGAGKKLVELYNLPSLNVRGMASSRVGDGAANVVPATATASIDMRLVKGIRPEQAEARLIQHIRQQGYHVVVGGAEPDAETRRKYPKVAWVTRREGGYPAERTSMDLPVSKRVIAAVEAAKGEKVIKLPTSGGSVPIFMISEILKTVTISVPIANHDNNQHSYNENLRLKNLFDGIELMAALLVM
jgi:acetylornithine deacetylase/succinyl-diaminopimelate desuccinylase-like protein